MLMQPGGTYPVGDDLKWKAFVIYNNHRENLPGRFPSAAKAKEFMRRYVSDYNEFVSNPNCLTQPIER